MISKQMLALAGAALLFGSTAATAQSAAPLSLSGSPAVERAGASSQDASELRGGYGWILAIVAIGIAAFIISELGSDPELPNSP